MNAKTLPSSWARHDTRLNDPTSRLMEPGAEPRSEPTPANWVDELASLPDPISQPQPTLPPASLRSVIAVGSGKGGVGKTVVSSSLALRLARSGAAPVVAVDADLGGANLHSGLGIRRPDFALNRFALEQCTLRELPVPSGVPGLKFLSGASDIVGLSEFSAADQARFLSELRCLTASTAVLDLGAGSSLFNLDLFSLADRGVVVTTPEPTAVQNAYGFLRAAIYRRIQRLFDGDPVLRRVVVSTMVSQRGGEASASVSALAERLGALNREAGIRLVDSLHSMRVGLVVNMSDGRKGAAVGERLCHIVRQHLAVRLEFLGEIVWDESVRRSIREWRPLLLEFRRAPAAKKLIRIADRIADGLQSAPELRNPHIPRSSV